MARRGNFEDEAFEREWREAMEESAQAPPPVIWNNIGRELAYQQQVKLLQRKATVYQWASAAAIFIASLLGINYLISDQVIYSSAIPQDEFSIPGANVGFVPIMIPDDDVSSHAGGSSTTLHSLFSGAAEETEVREEARPEVLAMNTQSLNQISVASDLDVNLERKMYIRPIVNASIKAKRKEDTGSRYWTGISASSGSFDPNYQAGSNNLLANSLDLSSNTFAMANSARYAEQSPVIREGMKAGITNSLGLNFGMKISSKWILESGIHYAQSDAVTQTNMVVESSRLIEPIAASSEAKGVTKLSSIVSRDEVVEYSFRDVSLDNQFQFASLPVKAGYILIEGQFSMIVNAGVSTNLYLGNKLIDPDDIVANVSIGPGSSSPYREISFAGMGGLQLGYNFLDNFDLTVEPFLRQPITTLTKESSSFISAPSGIGINTGIRYRFN